MERAVNADRRSSRAGRGIWRWALGAAAGLVWTMLSLTPGLAAGEGGPKVPRQLTIGINGWPAGLHPAIQPTVVKAYAEFLAWRRLTAYGRDFKPACYLCVTVPTLENGLAKVVPLPGGGKGLDVKYTIDPKATWADGVPVTTKDIQFSWEVGRRKDVGYANPEAYEHITSIEAIDDKTFIMHMDAARFDFNVLTFLVLPAHVERPAFESVANKVDYERASVYNRAPTTPGLWNGPYMMVDFQSGVYMTFARNPHWAGDKPYFDRITLKLIENTAALEQNLLSGDIDVVAGEIGFSIDQGLSIAQRLSDRFDVVFSPGLIYNHVDTNLDNPILQDVRVRRALLHAIDRDAINQRIYGGKVLIADSWVPPQDPGYSPDVPRYPYDKAKAAALLEEAGWRMGPGGIRVNAKGEKLRLELAGIAGAKLNELVQTILQSSWKEVGIDIVQRNEPQRTYFGQTVTRRKFTGLAFYAWSLSPENPPQQILRSEAVPTEANGWSGSNYMNWRNPEMDQLIEAVANELDPAKRKAIWARMHQIYATELPVLPLFFRPEVFVTPKWLKGMKATGHNIYSTTWVTEWRVAGDP